MSSKFCSNKQEQSGRRRQNNTIKLYYKIILRLKECSSTLTIDASHLHEYWCKFVTGELIEHLILRCKIWYSFIGMPLYRRLALVSVTRFGKISPLWSKVNNIWQTLYDLFCVWQHFAPTLAKLYVVFVLIFIVVNGKILKNNLAISSHL